MSDNIEVPTEPAEADSVAVKVAAEGSSTDTHFMATYTDSTTGNNTEGNIIIKTAEKTVPALKYVETVVPIKAPNIKVGTYIRAAAVLVTLLNQILVVLHKNPIPYTSDQVYDTLSVVAVVGATIWAGWKNNSFTKTARKAEEAGKNALIKVEAEKLSK